MFCGPMKVSVEQKHIDAGTPDDGVHCAIALAVREMVDPDTYVEVDTDGMIVGYERFSIPDVAQRFIERFDKKMPVEPITFEAALKDYDDDCSDYEE